MHMAKKGVVTFLTGNAITGFKTLQGLSYENSQDVIFMIIFYKNCWPENISQESVRLSKGHNKMQKKIIIIIMQSHVHLIR